MRKKFSYLDISQHSQHIAGDLGQTAASEMTNQPFSLSWINALNNNKH